MRRSTGCLAVHLPPLQSGYQRLTWYMARRFETVRVIEWTCCEHRSTFYELCAAGGLLFIRRYVNGHGIAYSDAWSIREGRERWRELLCGGLR